MAAILLVGSHQEPLPFLAQIDGAVEIDRVGNLLAERGELGDLVGDEVLMLHGHDGQLHLHEPTNLARPQSAGVHDILGAQRAARRVELPFAAGEPADGRDRRLAVDLRAGIARGLGIGIGDAARIDVAVVRIEHRRSIVRGVDERIARAHLVEIDEMQADLKMLRLGVLGLEKFGLVFRDRQVNTAGLTNAAGDARDALDLLVQLDGVGLERGDVGVAVERVNAACRVPGGAGGEIPALEQHHVAPAKLSQMIQNTRAHDAAADDRYPRVTLHGDFSAPVRSAANYPRAAHERLRNPEKDVRQEGRTLPRRSGLRRA